MEKDRLFPSAVRMILAMLVVITGSGLLAACQGGGQSRGIGDGPLMLFFYATW